MYLCSYVLVCSYVLMLLCFYVRMLLCSYALMLICSYIIFWVLMFLCLYMFFIETKTHKTQGTQGTRHIRHIRNRRHIRNTRHIRNIRSIRFIRFINMRRHTAACIFFGTPLAQHRTLFIASYKWGRRRRNKTTRADTPQPRALPPTKPRASCLLSTGPHTQLLAHFFLLSTLLPKQQVGIVHEQVQSYRIATHEQIRARHALAEARLVTCLT